MHALLLLAVAAAAVAPDAGDAVVATLDGRTVAGVVREWTAGELSLDTADGTLRLAPSEVLDIRWERPPADSAAMTYIELVDGARFPYHEFSLTGRAAVVDTPLAPQPLRIPREAIRRVELRPAAPALVALLDEIDRKDAPGDALVVAGRDGQQMDYLTGVLGDVTAEQATFEWDGERVPVKRAKIAAIVLYQPRKAAHPDAVCQVSLADGARLPATEIAVRDGEIVALTTPTGIELQTPLETLIRADFTSGKLAYLSDLAPLQSRWTPGVGDASHPALAARYAPRNDVSFSGAPLSLHQSIGDSPPTTQPSANGPTAHRSPLTPHPSPLTDHRSPLTDHPTTTTRTYAKGLALRSRTEITYRLPPGMTRFKTLAGIDPSPPHPGQGHVLLTIRGDDRTLFEGPIVGGQPPVDIDVELAAARQLHLTVDFGEHLDYGDRLHLIEARVTK